MKNPISLLIIMCMIQSNTINKKEILIGKICQRLRNNIQFYSTGRKIGVGKMSLYMCYYEISSTHCIMSS